MLCEEACSEFLRDPANVVIGNCRHQKFVDKQHGYFVFNINFNCCCSFPAIFVFYQAQLVYPKKKFEKKYFIRFVRSFMGTKMIRTGLGLILISYTGMYGSQSALQLP